MCSVFSLIVGLTTVITACVSIWSSYWIQNTPTNAPNNASQEFHAGLWQTCDVNGCQALNMTQEMPGWFSASRIVLSVGAGTAGLSLLVDIIICCGCSWGFVLSIIICSIGCLGTAGALITFSIQYARTDFLNFVGYSGTAGLTSGFYLAAASCVSFLLNTLISIYGMCTAKQRGYEPIGGEPINPTRCIKCWCVVNCKSC